MTWRRWGVAVLAAAAVCCYAGRARGTNACSDPLDVVRACATATAPGDVAVIQNLVAEDFQSVWEPPETSPATGKDAWINSIVAASGPNMPKLTVTLDLSQTVVDHPSWDQWVFRGVGVVRNVWDPELGRDMSGGATKSDFYVRYEPGADQCRLVRWVAYAH